ncbi:hypothetical protein H2204_015125 [Knufia peltigerae]|uniref:Uncharacterized protein n=1 Tax=Knufia peltigerae TaxID=1002370 RepID=A0AA38XEY1_9EURO|nr:hypothetical protein H2204_015125 [Knufia peltigerae]
MAPTTSESTTNGQFQRGDLPISFCEKGFSDDRGDRHESYSACGLDDFWLYERANWEMLKPSGDAS